MSGELLDLFKVVPIASQASISLCQASESCEAALDRLALHTSSAGDGVSSAVSDGVESVSVMMKEGRMKAKRLCAEWDKRLEWQCDELDACKSLLEACERQLCTALSNTIEDESIESSLSTAGRLLAEVDFLPSRSYLTFSGGVDSTVLTCMSHLQVGIDVGKSGVSHSVLLTCGEGNSVSIACRDAEGDAVNTISAEDVTIGFSKGGFRWSVSDLSVGAATVSVSVIPGTGTVALRSATLVVTLGSTRVDIPLQAASSIFGNHVRSICVSAMDGYVGLAISPDGAVMAVSNEGTNSILLYRLPDGELQAEVWARGTRNGGKEGDFSVPQKMCFSPLNGNLLFVDWVENRVKEMTVVGSPVRTIGKGAFDDSVLCIAASQKCIATGLANKVVLLDIVSGVQIRSFGAYGSAQGQLNCCSSVRFTPEGDHLLVAENGNKRLSLFSVTGDFVRAIGVGVINGPVDLDFAPNHDILVADFSNVVSVLSHDGSTLARTFGNESGALKQLLRPCAVAVHNGLLYVLDLSARVQVFA